MAYRPQSPDLSGLAAEPFGHRPESPQQREFPLSAAPLSLSVAPPLLLGNALGATSSAYHAPVTFLPQSVARNPQCQPPPTPTMPASTRGKHVNYAEHDDDDDDDDVIMSDAPAPKKPRRIKQECPNGSRTDRPFDSAPISAPVPSASPGDPTLGCQLKTSFPVARIKRIMQADEDIGKVAQVTPTVVSRALELFMIKLISAAAHQARGPEGVNGGTKGPRRVLAQHLKKAIAADEKLDFLEEIVSKVPDAPTRAKKDAASDSEDSKPKKKGKKRKDSGDDS